MTGIGEAIIIHGGGTSANGRPCVTALAVITRTRSGCRFRCTAPPPRRQLNRGFLGLVIVRGLIVGAIARAVGRIGTAASSPAE
ncbi:hypothetical protein C3E77_12785 [Mycetocola zhujimingii]|uniref:Uncharacterized protein n=1 Tax=Mycetocola zhujimingii TaxID=2079792 RepID=A0A2U1TBK3_9MICO|nr:hypothetical protein [Mycetocola zhujimingii]AWB87401.1 hypothetical protein C3E77_12785 [Mycetocola zhujimingii]PWC06180.1 hypothetical protein DF223_11185 [Mycetocola zhujimingii]